MQLPRPAPLVCPAFRKAYPEHAARAQEMGVRVGKLPKRRSDPGQTFIMESNYQVTGYSSRRLADGSTVPFTAADADRLIGDTLDKIAAGRALNAMMTREARFERALAALLRLEVRHRMISSWADHGGDHASVADWRGGGPLDCRIWIGKDEVARADVRTLAEAAEPLRASFAALGAKQAA